MSKSKEGTVNHQAINEGHGYWLYADGESYWGCAVYKFGEVPRQITVELHKKDVAEKVKWYNEKTAEIANAEKEAKEAEEAEKAKTKKS